MAANVSLPRSCVSTGEATECGAAGLVLSRLSRTHPDHDRMPHVIVAPPTITISAAAARPTRD